MEFELRPWRMEDVEAVARYANNPKVAAIYATYFPIHTRGRTPRSFFKAVSMQTPPGNVSALL